MITISMGFDGTKVPQCLQVDHAHKAIVGGVLPDHSIDVRDKIAEELNILLDPKSSIVQSKVVKLCVMLFQQPGFGKSLISSLGAFPQGINAKSSFNKQVTNVLLDLCRE